MTTARRTFVASLGLALALVASTTGNTACEGPCSIPTERIALELPPPLETQCAQAAIGVRVGVVHNDGATLVLQIGGEGLSFPGLDAGIPDGTFVRLLYICHVIPQFDQGRMLAIENVPELGGVANPTESGTRLWHLVAGGGTLLLAELPIDYALEQVCQVGNDVDGRLDSEALIIADGNKGVIVPPGQTRSVTLTRGPHAGEYSVENVNITFSSDTFAGDDFPIAVNFRIRRAD